MAVDQDCPHQAQQGLHQAAAYHLVEFIQQELKNLKSSSPMRAART